MCAGALELVICLMAVCLKLYEERRWQGHLMLADDTPHPPTIHTFEGKVAQLVCWPFDRAT